VEDIYDKVDRWIPGPALRISCNKLLPIPGLRGLALKTLVLAVLGAVDNCTWISGASYACWDFVPSQLDGTSWIGPDSDLLSEALNRISPGNPLWEFDISIPARERWNDVPILDTLCIEIPVDIRRELLSRIENDSKWDHDWFQIGVILAVLTLRGIIRWVTYLSTIICSRSGMCQLHLKEMIDRIPRWVLEWYAKQCMHCKGAKPVSGPDIDKMTEIDLWQRIKVQTLKFTAKLCKHNFETIESRSLKIEYIKDALKIKQTLPYMMTIRNCDKEINLPASLPYDSSKESVFQAEEFIFSPVLPLGPMDL
jgi:hypothetical protein